MTDPETNLARPHVFLPADGTPTGPPLLLLHGTGGDEHDLLPLREVLSPGPRCSRRAAPYATPPETNLAGLTILISNGDRDPMIPRTQTELLIAQLRERGASVTDLPHAGGHQVDGAVLERVAGLLDDLV